ncbi:hypothetical protein Tco_1286229 [Tanacetum coccineum]
MVALFFPNWFLFQDLSTDKVVAFRKGINHLYTCNSSSSLPAQSELSKFHDRMGHISLSKMISDCKSLDVSDFFCDTCMIAKNHRLLFNRSTTVSSFPFELLHVDLWGQDSQPESNTPETNIPEQNTPLFDNEPQIMIDPVPIISDQVPESTSSGTTTENTQVPLRRS